MSTGAAGGSLSCDVLLTAADLLRAISQSAMLDVVFLICWLVQH